MKRILLSILVVLSFFEIKAQYAMEALSYSQTDLLGSAAFVGRGGAIGALGADFTAASYNPAGLGLFYSSQIAITPSWEWNLADADYMGNSTNDSRTIFAFTNANYLFAFKTNNQEGWKAVQFGVGINKLRSFNNRTYIEGNPINSSLLTVWTDYANESGGYERFTSLLAKTCGLMSYDSITDSYVDIFKGDVQSLKQTRNFVESGGISEMAMSFSGNYDDKLYLGATMGIPFLSYRSSMSYSEQPEKVDTSIGLDYFDFFESKNIDGGGINFKVGAIYRPIDNIRLGLAFHTPTYYEINESYSTTVESSILADPSRNTYRNSEATSYGMYTYNFSTPFKLLANAAVTFGDMSSKLAGSLSFDYEFTNYRTMRFSGDDYMSQVNDEIKDTYRASHTFRMGGTLNVKKFSFRVGAVYSTDPYKEELDMDASKMSLACGVGYQTRQWFVDLAYAHTEQKDKLSFVSNPDDPILIENYRNILVLTLGMKF